MVAQVKLLALASLSILRARFAEKWFDYFSAKRACKVLRTPKAGKIAEKQQSMRVRQKARTRQVILPVRPR